ncbi:MAG TPA: ABC transporter permease [Baekduia sp.]|jgi:peptide/nickel transport system permease protein
MSAIGHEVHELGQEPDGLASLAVAPTGRRVPPFGLLLAGGWLVLLVGAAILAGLLPLHDPQAPDAFAPRSGMTSAHWLGTDQLGRDLLSRVIYGARVSLVVAFTATALAAVVGSTLGLIAGYARGMTETIIMGFVDIMLAFPALILALSLTSFLGASELNVIIAIAVLAVPSFARVVRAQTLSLTTREYVRAARSLGAGRTRILAFELAPNLAPAIFAYALVVVAIAIVIEGTLSFLGLGVPAPTPSWGGMISAGTDDLAQYPLISMVPAVAMFFTVLAINVVAEWLQARFAPRRHHG